MPIPLPKESFKQKEQKNVKIKYRFKSNTIPPKSLTFYEYLLGEILGADVENADVSRHSRVNNFLRVPFELEKLLIFGYFVAFDCFLYVFTFLPIRIAVTTAKTLLSIISKRFKYRQKNWYDILRGMILGVSCLALALVDMSRLYHAIRGQAMIKLYVLFTMIEIFDKLCCSLGQDVLDALYYTARDRSRNRWRLAIDFAVAAVFVVLHSLLLFAQVVTFNVAINSSNSSLLTLLISNNFAEIKTSVFKRFEEKNLFQIACSDIVERFKLVLILTLIMIQSHGDGDNLWFGAGLVLVAEIFVDWVKHAFISKFNCIDASVYHEFMNVLCRDISGCRKENAIVDHTHNVSRRIGLVSLPLAAVVIRMMSKILLRSSVMFRSLSGMLLALVTFLSIIATKLLTSMLLMIHACRMEREHEIRTSPQRKQSVKLEKSLEALANVERYDLVKGRIV